MGPKPYPTATLEQVKSTIEPILKAQDCVLFAYLFGSVAKGSAHEESDLDVAVYMSDLPDGAQGDIEAIDFALTLQRDLEAAMRRSVDVVVLNRASPPLCQNVLAHGHLIVSRDDRARVRFQVNQMHRYQDYAMQARIFDRYRKRRIEEGTFGGGSPNRSQTP